MLTIVFAIAFVIGTIVAALVLLWIGAMAMAFGQVMTGKDTAFVVLASAGVGFIFASLVTGAWWLIGLAWAALT